MNVSFIGLGIMGSRMARNLLKQDGITLTVCNYDAQFPLELMLKDLQLLDVTAYEQKQPLFLAGLAKSIYGQANSAGHGREDFAKVFDYLAKPG